MDTRSAVVVVSAVIAATGAALLVVAWTMGSVSWLLADLPGADNDLLRELGIGALGVAFVAVAVVGAGRALFLAGRRTSTGAAVTAGVLAILSFLVAVVGAGHSAAQATATVLAPVVDEPDLLTAPAGDGRLVVGFALALAVGALAVLVAPRTSLPRAAVLPTEAVPAGR